MDGQCRFSEKICWNKHDPDKKGQNVKSKEACNSVFQERQEEQRPPGLEGEGWEDSASRKKKRRMRGTTPQAKVKGIQEVNSSQNKEGGTTPTFPVDGEKEQMTPTFPPVGEPSQQILMQVLQALLQQAGVSQ